MAENKTFLQTLGFAFGESEVSFASQCVFTTLPLGLEAISLNRSVEILSLHVTNSISHGDNTFPLLVLIIIATITETTFAKRPEFLNSLNTSLIGTINNELAYDVDQIRLRRRVHQKA